MANLPQTDLYALARWATGFAIPEHLPIANPVVADFIHKMDSSKPENMRLFRALFDDHMAAILYIDPNSPPPKPVSRHNVDTYIPSLPVTAQLSSAAVTAAARVGGLVQDIQRWAKQRSPMTPDLFLESGALTSIGIVIARRCVVQFDTQKIYPHSYDLWVAPTTYFRKSTALSAIVHLLTETVPHLLLSTEFTPEMLQFKLSGRVAPNYSDLPLYQQRIEDKGKRFAGQRALIVDEATSQIFPTKKYMEGTAELLMKLYDAPPLITREIRNEGQMMIVAPAVSVIGATTPARLARALTGVEWDDGLLARMALLTPDKDTIKRPTSSLNSDSYDPPAALKARLLNLYRSFPEPPEVDLSADEPPTRDAVSCLIDAEALAAYNAYADALHDMTRPNAGLDTRLTGNYGRLATLALKQAIRLAAADWADSGARQSPQITIAHWACGQQICEEYRQSVHRLLEMLTRPEDVKIEDAVLNYIASSDTPPTQRDIYRGLNILRKQAYEALRALIDDGQIIDVPSGGQRGRKSVGYVLVDNLSAKNGNL